MNEKFLIGLILSILFGFIAEAIARNAPGVAVFIGATLLSQIYWNSFEQKKKVQVLKSPSKFATEMKMFKK